jgi:hypothetical protein
MLEFIGTITAIGMMVSVGWVLINNILMPFLWEVATTTLKSVFKALTSKIRKEVKNNNM